ncbi:MAG: hypothetical protein JNL04_09625 [Rhodospirillaceae bacterium]|nr:hypothetical protein [Rhodospirillaceae bacterium]
MAKKLRPEVRETGTANVVTGQKAPAPALIPPDPQDLGRPMTDDEKVDEALLESMDASDPPAIGAPSRVGSPKERKTPPVEQALKTKRRQAAE